MFDASLCRAAVSADALRRFFTHSLTHTLTYKPKLTGKESSHLQLERLDSAFVKKARSLFAICRKSDTFF